MLGDAALFLIFSILYFSVVVWAGMFWLSIKLLERDNPYNKFLTALVYSALRIAIAFVAAFLAMGYFTGLTILAMYLVFGVRLLMYHYELSFWKSVAVMGLMVAMPELLDQQIIKLAGDSMTRLIAVFYGLPTAILVTWVIGRWRMRYARRPSNLPEARIMKRAPTDVPPPAPVPVVVAKAVRKASGNVAALAAEPASVSQPLIPLRSSAPDIEIPAAPSEGPKFLR